MAAASIEQGVLKWSDLSKEQKWVGIKHQRFARLQFDCELTETTLQHLYNFLVSIRLAGTKRQFIDAVAGCARGSSLDKKIQKLFHEVLCINIHPAWNRNGSSYPFNPADRQNKFWCRHFGLGVGLLGNFYKHQVFRGKGHLFHPLNKELLEKRLDEYFDLEKIPVVAEYLSLFWFYGKLRASAYLHSYLQNVSQEIVDADLEQGSVPVDEETLQRAELEVAKNRLEAEKKMKVFEDGITLLRNRVSDFPPGDFRFEIFPSVIKNLSEMYRALHRQDYFNLIKRKGAPVALAKKKIRHRLGNIGFKNVKKGYICLLHRIGVDGWDAFVDDRLHAREMCLGAFGQVLTEELFYYR